MTILNINQVFQNKQKLNFLIMVCTMLFIATNIILDYLLTIFQKSSFYISESMFFSSYWLLFLPLLTFFPEVTKRAKRLELKFFIISLAIIFHLLLYPALVWMISKIFYYHTFDYWQTFNFGLQEYFIKTVIIYAFSTFVFTIVNKKQEISQIPKTIDKSNILTSILVSDNHNKKLILHLNDVSHFSANSPYIEICHSSKKYLYTETLKSLQTKLDGKQFVRIHKSHIVNIYKITSIQSRKNGDYDIELLDNSILRVSRNYAKNFKSAVESITHLTTK